MRKMRIKYFNLNRIHRTEDSELIEFINRFRLDIVVDDKHVTPDQIKESKTILINQIKV